MSAMRAGSRNIYYTPGPGLNLDRNRRRQWGDQSSHGEVQFSWLWASSFLLGLSFPICDTGMSAWTQTAGPLPALACGMGWGGVGWS